MKGLTLIQPWGTAIICYGKNLENREWGPPDRLVGERVAIHAGKKFSQESLLDIQDLGHAITREECVLGAILGTVELAGYVDVYAPKYSVGLTALQIDDALESDWRAVGAKFAWVLRAPRVLAEPIPFKGSLGLWEVPADIIKRIERATEAA